MRDALRSTSLLFALACIAAGATSGTMPVAADNGGLLKSPGEAQDLGRTPVEIVGAQTTLIDDLPARTSEVVTAIAPRGVGGDLGLHALGARFQPDVPCEWTDLALGTGTAGRLEAGDCSFGMLDGTVDPSYVDQYRVTIPERGSLHVSVVGDSDVDIDVRDMTFASLGTTGATGGVAAELDLTLPAGDYLVLVRPSSFSPGVETGYTLTTAFDPEALGGPGPEPCTVGTLTPGVEAADSLGGDGACRVFDHLPAVLLDSYGDIWSIDVAISGVLNVELSSPDFSPMLMLLDDSKEFTLASDASGLLGDPDPLTSSISAHVAPGRYHVLAAGTFADGAGDYTLRADLTPNEAGRCTPLDVSMDAVVEGTLDDADCRLSYTRASMFDDSSVDLLRIFVPQPGTMRFVLEGDGITPTVRLLDTDLQPLLGGRLMDDDVVRFPFAGHLIIAVQSLEGINGSYSVDFQYVIEGATACAVQAIGTSETKSGELSADDCSLEDYALLSDTSRVDLYTIRLPSRGRLTIDMRSTEIDSYLWIVAGLFDYNLQNDDIGGDSSNSRLSVVLQAGDYVIVANSTLPEVGPYTLTTAFVPESAPSPCPTATILPSTTVNGSLAAGDCIASDFDSGRYSATRVKRYVLTLDQRGRLDVSAASEEFFPRLTIRDPATGLAVLEDADEEHFVMEASVGLVVGPGTYWLEVEEVDGIPEVDGSFSLTTAFTPEPTPACSVTEIDVLPVSIPGAIDESDCMLRDRIGDYPQNRVDEYTFTLAQRGTLTIDLLGEDWEEFDPYLELQDYRYGLIAANNDAVDGFVPDSHIEIDVGPGRYRVLAMEANLQTGAYELEIAFDPESFTPPPTSAVTPDPGPGTTAPTPGEPTPTPPRGTVGPVVAVIYLPSTQSNRR